MTKLHIGAVLLGAGAMSIAWTANAQTESEGLALEEVVITGSRVITNGNDSPTPVTVVTVEEMQATRPTTVFEGLLDMPVFAGSRGATTNPQAGGSTNNNISALNLRGLGQNRTLVLYDGHRVPPGQANGFVDANMIPQMLLQRVDVVTGGASAVYGSDAISGVVNFVTDRKFNGVKAQAQTGISEYGDDHSYELGLAFGTDLFAGRGHFMGSIQRHYDQGILKRTDRPVGVPRWTLQGTGTAATPWFLVANATLGNLSFGGKINGPNTAANALRNTHFVSNGVLAPFVAGSTAGVIGNIQIGGDGAYFTTSSLKVKMDFDQLYGRFDFDITDDLHFYVTAAGTQMDSFNYSTNNQIAVTMSSTNAFLSPTYQTQLSAAGTTFTFGKMWKDSVPPTQADNDVSQWFVNTGLEGRLGDYNWDVSYTRSIAKLDSRDIGTLDNGRLYAALDATLVTAGNVGSTGLAQGTVVCNVALTHPGLYPGCVPLNVFGPSSETQSAINYIMRPGIYKSQSTMDDVSASIAGAPFSTWAGPLDMALSGEWRRVAYELTSNSLPVSNDPLACTGLRFNCTAGTTPKWSSATANRPEVSQTVSEAALEANVPLLTEVPFAQSVSVNTAGRYARYSQTGSPIVGQPDVTKKFDARTGKVGLVWEFNDVVTLRATRSRDFRAPTLNDLFAPGTVSIQTNLPDNLTNVTQATTLQTGGNPNLIPEVGYTSTIGFVVKPTAKLSLAIDGYDINIKNAITNANGYGPQSQTACYQSGGASFYCTLQERPVSVATAIANPTAANAVTKWYGSPLNIAEQKTWGIDFEANYSTDLFDRPFSVRALVAYQPHAEIIQVGVQTQDLAGVNLNNNNQAGAIWRSTVSLRYSPIDNVTVNWSTRWRDTLTLTGDPTRIVLPNSYGNKVPSASFSNMSVSYRINSESKGQADLYFNVQNVFDKVPFPTASGGPQGSPGNFGGYAPGDDPVGRYYSVGVRYRM